MLGYGRVTTLENSDYATEVFRVFTKSKKNGIALGHVECHFDSTYLAQARQVSFEPPLDQLQQFLQLLRSLGLGFLQWHVSIRAPLLLGAKWRYFDNSLFFLFRVNLFRDDAAVELIPSISGQQPSSDKQILKSLDGVVVPVGRSYGEDPVSDLIALNRASAALRFSRCLTDQWHEFSSF